VAVTVRISSWYTQYGFTKIEVYAKLQRNPTATANRAIRMRSRLLPVYKRPKSEQAAAIPMQSSSQSYGKKYLETKILIAKLNDAIASFRIISTIQIRLIKKCYHKTLKHINNRLKTQNVEISTFTFQVNLF